MLTESLQARRDTIPVAQHTHQTAPTQFVNAAGVRFAQPDDTGGLIAFLASDDVRWNTGDTVRVHGGSKL
ncbi:MAG: putative oxidoreductase [Gemmatimonadetes bacterium]|nr:putative oxidoreductase [Gemmatimonadota bacterium]